MTHRKTKNIPNPWYDSRNELSPKEYTVIEEPIESDDIMDFYEVLNDYQVPSVLAVINGKRLGDNKGDRAIGQYVTLNGAKRAIFGEDYMNIK